MVTGVVHPPYGDTLVVHLDAALSTNNARLARAAGAVSAAACRQIGHVPTVNGIENLIRTRWSSRRYSPSRIPLRAIGHEQQLLLPVLHAARGTDGWIDMVLNCIDAMDMLNAVGSNPQGVQAGLADALTGGGNTLDPRIVIRLAASRCGQIVLSERLTIASPPVWTDDDSLCSARHIIPHRMSPWWATAPLHLREWWATTIERVAASRFGTALAYPPPLYPTVIPQAAVLHPTIDLVPVPPPRSGTPSSQQTAEHASPAHSNHHTRIASPRCYPIQQPTRPYRMCGLAYRHRRSFHNGTSISFGTLSNPIDREQYEL